MSFYRVTREQFRALLSVADNKMIGARSPRCYNPQTMSALFRKGLVYRTRYGIKPTELALLIVQNRRADG